MSEKNGKPQTIDFAALTAFFPPNLIQWRYQRKGENNTGYFVPFIDSRTIMSRLDRVCGPENWKVEYTQVDARGIELPLPEAIWQQQIAKQAEEAARNQRNRREKPPTPTKGGFLCTLYIRHNGEWIGKTDGADVTDIEAFKGSLTQGIRRAAVLWGITRYLHAILGQYLPFNYVNGKPTPTQAPIIPAWAIPPEPTKEEINSKPLQEEEEEEEEEKETTTEGAAPQKTTETQEGPPPPEQQEEQPAIETTEKPPNNAPQNGQKAPDGTEPPPPERIVEFRHFLGEQLERLGGICDEVDDILREYGLDEDDSKWQVKNMTFAAKKIRAISAVPLQ